MFAVTPCYSFVKTDSTTISGLGCTIVEAPAVNGRIHKRIIGHSAQLGSPLDGRPLLYADTYVATRKTYVYARHGCDPETFFAELDRFYFDEIQNYPELLNRKFAMILNAGGQLHETESLLPYSHVASVHSDVRFFRMAIPFGDVAIEFGPQQLTLIDSSYLCRGELPRALEGPLFGCDLTRSTLLGKFMSRLHWAKNLVSPAILENMIGEIITDAVPA